MAVKNYVKINEVAGSKFVLSHLDQEYKPTSNVAVAFGRVSIKKNKDSGNSDLDQIERILEYAADKAFEIARQWDVAETGHKHGQRREFKEMVGTVLASQQTAHPIKHVLFSHQSRSNRNRESARELEMLIRQHGVTIHCVRDNLVLHANSPLEDWMRWDLFNCLNEKFSKDHKKNVMVGMQKRIEMGLSPFLAPYGYKNQRLDGPDSLSVFLVVDDEAQYVVRMFELFATGRYALTALKAELDRLYPAMRGKLSVKRFGEILRNPFYYGWFVVKGEVFKGHQEHHPRLITKDLFDKVQKILNQPARSKRKVTKREHAYLGLIKCGGRLLDDHGNETDIACGCAVTAEEQRKKLADGTVKVHVYYHCTSLKRCSQRDRKYAANHAFKLNHPETVIEGLLGDILAPLSFTPDVVKWMQDHLLNEHHEKSGDHRQQMAALRRRLEMLSQMIDRAYEDKVSGDLAATVWREKDAKWRAEREDIKAQINALDGKKDDYIHKGVELIELVHDLENIYKSATPNKKRRIIEIVSSNHVLIDGTLRFEYRKPFDLLARTASKEIWWS